MVAFVLPQEQLRERWQPRVPARAGAAVSVADDDEEQPILPVVDP